MTNLTQIKDYCDYLDEHLGEIDVALITSEPALTVASVSADRRRTARGWIVAFGVAVLVLGVFLPFIFFVGEDTKPPAATVPVTAPPVTVTAPPVTTTIDSSELVPVVVGFDESERPRLENQWEFLAWFSEPGSGGCSGPAEGPYICRVEYQPPLVFKTVIIETVVQNDQTTPGEPGSPDDRPLLTVQMTESRQLLEPVLADLYNWALSEYPEETEAACGVGFETNDLAIAWNPGYRADISCGEHLSGLVSEFWPDSQT